MNELYILCRSKSEEIQSKLSVKLDGAGGIGFSSRAKLHTPISILKIKIDCPDVIDISGLNILHHFIIHDSLQTTRSKSQLFYCFISKARQEDWIESMLRTILKQFNINLCCRLSPASSSPIYMDNLTLKIGAPKSLAIGHPSESRPSKQN